MPNLFRYLYVAGLGRRETGPAATLRPRLRELLQRLAATAPEAQPIALASGAAGADQLFLTAAHELGWPIKFVLPAPVYLFEKDFTTKDATGATVTDEVALAEFRRLCAAAIEIEVIPPAAGRRGSFTRCADRLIADADVLVALWDGQPGKQGGTNESLLLAHQLAVPLVLLDAKTGITWNGQPQPDAASLARRHRARHHDEHGRASGILHDVGKSIAEGLQHATASEKDPQPPRTLAAFLTLPLSEQRRRLGSTLANRANTLADRHRDWNRWALGLHGLATATGLIALIFEPALPAWAPHGASCVKLALVCAAIGITIYLRQQRAHHRWVRARFVREINRSLSETAALSRATGEAIGAFVPASIWATFSRLRLPLLTFHALASQSDARGSFPEVLAHYRARRLAHQTDYREIPANRRSQRDYQLAESERAKRHHHRIEIIFWACTATLLGCAVAGVGLTHESVFYGPVKFGTVFLPVVVASLLVLPNLHDNHRRRIVGPALVAQLARLDAELQAVEAVLKSGGVAPVPGTAVPVWQGTAEEKATLAEAWAKQRAVEIARDAENALLTEVIGFKTFIESVEVG